MSDAYTDYLRSQTTGVCIACGKAINPEDKDKPCRRCGQKGAYRK